ncbi:hypothetical protein OC835_001513 [Tilletia horrida]|uniref:FF domain-containing protein n=1 Tax=Tilletia horrida TaxID=155126 RepID=A0AAN6JL41_9BASI|nr:hypothetical protein OC842_003500 [Tilletia horrida]KAK0538156.1 hypothetical protein OC835_001513 [Tilletia horrida]
MAAQPEAKRRKLDTETPPPLLAFRELLEAEVKSTRTKWADFLKAHKRDRRFLGYGRSDRDREKAFKDWLVELGERKREAQLRAEDDFLSLLVAQVGAETGSTLRQKVEDIVKSAGVAERKAAVQAVWTEAKRTPGLDRDARYEAVGSSTRRAELFAEWLDGKRARQTDAAATPAAEPAQHGASKAESRPAAPALSAAEREKAAREQRRKDKALEAERALKAREEQVRRERQQAESRQRRVLNHATHAEDALAFKQMLIDYVRDPLMTFAQLSDTLGRTDRRFSGPSLGKTEPEHLFLEHRANLLDRRRKALHSIFQKVAPSLATEKEVALPLVREDDEWERAELGRLLLGEKEQRARAKEGEEGDEKRRERLPVSGDEGWYGLRRLDEEWERWNAARHAEAERDFKEMLNENGFVEFWGRLKHHRQTHDPDAPPAEDLDSDDEDAVGMLEMARQIDLDEVDAVLRPEARYQAWKHKPELRERWIREHMEQLAAPLRQTVHRTGLAG